MDVLTILQTIARRWLVVVPILIVTIFGAFVVGTGTEPEYEVDGAALLVSEGVAPSTTAESFAVVTGPVFAETLRTREVSNRMGEAGATVPYAVEVDPVTSIIRVEAASPDPAGNVRTVEAVLDNLDEELARLEEAAGVAGGQVELLLQPSDQPGAGAPSAVGSAFLVPRGAGAPNPYPPSGYTTRVLGEIMLGTEAGQRVVALAGGSATFTVTQQPRDPAPIMSISVLATDAGVAERTFDAVKATLDEVLEERQDLAGVDDQSRTRLDLLTTPGGAVETSGTLVKSVATVVGLGLVAAATAAILVESIFAARTDRRRKSSGNEHSSVRNGEGPQAESLPEPSEGRPLSNPAGAASP